MPDDFGSRLAFALKLLPTLLDKDNAPPGWSQDGWNAAGGGPIRLKGALSTGPLPAYELPADKPSQHLPAEKRLEPRVVRPALGD